MLMQNDTALLRHLPDTHRPHTENERIAHAQLRMTRAKWLSRVIGRFWTVGAAPSKTKVSA